MKLGAHGPNRRTSGPRAQIMRKSIFTAESQFSWNWVLTAQIDAQAVPELRSWENQFLRPNRNFHEIGCSRPKSTHKRSPSSDHEKINFYGRIAIFMKLGAHGPNRLTSGPRAQIMRKSIFTAESQFSWNWVLTAQIDAQVVPELRTSEWENQFLRPNRNFHEIAVLTAQIDSQACSPSSDHEKINFYGRIAIFMKLGAHGPNRLTSGPRAQIMRKSIFIGWSRPKSTHKAVPELRSWENQFLRSKRNFHEIGCSRPKSTHKRSPSSDHEKINFYGRIANFMKLAAHGPNRLTSGPRAQIMRKSIFTAESQFSWNWVLTAQIDAQVVPELRTSECQFLRPNRNFHEIGCSRPKSTHKKVPELRSWENQFLRPNRNFHEIGCSRPKSTHKRSPSSDHEKINFYGRIAIFMKLGAHGPNRLTSGPRAQIMRKSIFTAESQFSWNWVITAQIDSQSGPRAQIMRKSIFTAESQFSWNWVLTAQIDAQAVPELRSWENQFLRPNRNFHEIGCSRPKSTHKRSPSSDHEKINFYGRIAIFMKLGDHGPNRLTKRSPSSDHEKINFYGRNAIFMKLGAHARNRCTSGPRAQIMRKSIFTAESQFSWNWVLTAQIDAQVVPELKTSEYQFLRSNRNFHEIGCSRPKSTHKSSPSSEHQNINF